MNDMQKPTSGSVKIDTLIARQENARKVRELRLSGRNPIGPLEIIPAVRIVNALPNIDDGQDFTLPLTELATGNVVVELSEWPNMDAAYSLWFKIDDEDDWGERHTVELGFGTAEFAVPLGQAAFIYGTHTVEYMVKSTNDGNEKFGEPSPFFVDIFDPNRREQPDKPILPPDLTNGVITPEYLDDNGGVTFTLPTPLDSRPEDTFCMFVNDNEIITDQPAVAPFEVLVPAAFFQGLAEGNYEITYTLKDRAGNESIESFDTTVKVVKTPEPKLELPVIIEGPEITLDEARDGVWVECDYETRKAGDIITVIWAGEIVDSVQYPENSVLVPFTIIAKPGTEYAGKVKYQLHQDTLQYESGEVDITVDLEQVGPPNPEGPDEVINPDLELLELESSTQQKNAIVPADKGQPATITVPLYDAAKVGDMITVFYGGPDGMVGNPLGLTAENVAAGEVSLPILWEQISALGNGNIPAFYRISPQGKPNNYQQSLNTTIVVTVNNMADLPVASFPGRDVEYNIINCGTAPWVNGVDVRLDYPDFVDGDTVIVHWVLDGEFLDPDDTYVPVDDPIEETRRDFPDTVGVADVAAGYIVVNVPWGIWLSARIRATIVVSWTLSRDEHTSGTSDLSMVRLSRFVAGGGHCGP